MEILSHNGPSGPCPFAAARVRTGIGAGVGTHNEHQNYTDRDRKRIYWGIVHFGRGSQCRVLPSAIGSHVIKQTNVLGAFFL